MSAEIWVAIIAGAFSVLGVIITNAKSNKEVTSKLDKTQAVTDTKIEELTREVREHNGFARKIPVLEEQMKSTERRLKTLESYHRGE